MTPFLTGPADEVQLRGGAWRRRTVAVNASSGGANTVIAAATSKIIRVVSYVLVCAGAVTVTWESDSGSVIGGPIACAANGGVAAPYNPLGHFDTIAGEGLVLYLSGGVQVGGHVTYLIAA